MKPFEHIQKAGRLEASLRKLDPLDDYEMVIDTCMNATTHYFNAALHAGTSIWSPRRIGMISGVVPNRTI